MTTNSSRWRARSRPLALLTLLAAGALLPAPAAAQDSVRTILGFLLTNRSVVTGDFERDEAALRATSDAIGRALQLEVATLPLGSSSGAFTYRFNPALGTSERASTNFGAFFVERAVTAGRGRASFGLSVRYNRFERLDGTRLRDGSLVTTANQFADEPRAFDQESLRLRLDTAIATGFLGVGLTDWLDVSVAVPVVSLRLEGERFDSFRGQDTLQASATAEVTGLADIALRTKVRLGGHHGSGVSLGGEVRLPTGRRDDLLGAGRATYRGLVIASLEGQAAALAVNAGYSAGGISDQIDYGVNLALSPAARLTISAEAFGRRIEAGGRLAPLSLPHPTISGVHTTRLAQEDGRLLTGAAVLGVKWNVAGAWLLGANVLAPLGSRGLQADYSPSVALEYTFGR